MITTRSLLPESVIAGWISWYLHGAEGCVLTRRREAACFLLNVRISVGRRSTPSRRATPISAFSCLSESGWQTTRVVPTLDLSSADASERAFGTAPPAGGW